MIDINELKTKVARAKGRFDMLDDRLTDTVAERMELTQELAWVQDAQAIVQAVATRTQEELRYHITEPVSLALSAIFGEEAYAFDLEFVQRRNKTEADISFRRGGEQISPMDSAGGGAVDVAAFALRAALLNLAPGSSSVLLLDEPFRFLSKDLHEAAAIMLSETAKELGLQIIMVTHSEDLAGAANKTFQVSIENGISEVREI